MIEVITQINVFGPARIIATNEESAGCEPIIGLEFGIGQAKLLLSLENAISMREKLDRQIALTQAELAAAKAERVEREQREAFEEARRNSGDVMPIVPDGVAEAEHTKSC